MTLVDAGPIDPIACETAGVPAVLHGVPDAFQAADQGIERDKSGAG